MVSPRADNSPPPPQSAHRGDGGHQSGTEGSRALRAPCKDISRVLVGFLSFSFLARIVIHTHTHTHTHAHYSGKLCEQYLMVYIHRSQLGIFLPLPIVNQMVSICHATMKAGR